MNDKNLLQAGYRYAYSLTHSAEQAEDLVQDAWVKIIRNQGKVKSVQLLYTSIKHLFIDDFRRSKLLIDEPHITSEQISANPLNSEIEFTQNEIHAALAFLKPGEREALFLHIYDGFRIDDIAEIKNKPRGTILSLIHRAKKKLKLKLEHIIQNRNSKILKFKAVK